MEERIHVETTRRDDNEATFDVIVIGARSLREYKMVSSHSVERMHRLCVNQNYRGGGNFYGHVYDFTRQKDV